jgi:GMP synthase (glutamine-hydrolysing)
MKAAMTAPRKVLIVLHQAHSRPGRYGRILRELGYALDVRRCCVGDTLPKTMDEHAGVAIFGGPMSANDDCSLDFIKAELDWIPEAVESGKPFLGICLGAQMLARTIGGRVYLHPEGKAEIGYFGMTPTPAAGTMFDGLERVYHWHREGFDLPRKAVILATGDMFENQAFRWGKNALGIQFHGEVTNAMRARWMVRAAHRLSTPGAQQPDEQIAGQKIHDPKVRVWAKRFLRDWIEGKLSAPR